MTSGVMGDMLLKQPGENLAFKGSTPWLTGAPCTSPVKVGLSYNLRIHAEDLDLLNLNQVFDARIAIKICKFVKFVPFSRCDAESLQVVLLIILLVSPVFAVQMVLLLCCRTRRGGLSEAVRVAMMFSYGFNCLPLHRVALLNWLKYYLNCLCPVVLCKQFCIFVLLYVRMWFSRSEISHNLWWLGKWHDRWSLCHSEPSLMEDIGNKVSFAAFVAHLWKLAGLHCWLHGPCGIHCSLGKKRGLSRKPSDE